MAETRARNYIERLPEIIQREEADVSHLDPEMLAILYPERAPKEITVSVIFGPPVPPETASASEAEAMKAGYERAVALAEKAREYRVEGRDRTLRHRATYGLDEVSRLHEIFSLVGDYPSCEILYRGQKVPYARELWLPFFWFFRREPA